MNRKRSQALPAQRRPAARQRPPAGGGKSLIVTLCMAAALVLAMVLFGIWISQQARLSAQRATPPPGHSATPAAAVDFSALVGQWVGGDGNARLAIHRVAADGAVDASYHNPRPVRIARAEASAAGGILRLYVELDHAGAPGSTYQLAFDPQRDRLAGSFLHAAIGQRLEVSLQRAP